MGDAPKDRVILVYNGVTGWYATKHDDGKWPLYNWKAPGVWYPEPERWEEYK